MSEKKRKQWLLDATAANRANPEHCAYKIAEASSIPFEDIPDEAFLLKADQSLTPKIIQKGLRLAKERGRGINK